MSLHYNSLPKGYRQKHNVGWLVVLIYVALVIFQPYRDLEAGDSTR